jgi:hypothetical protein
MNVLKNDRSVRHIHGSQLNSTKSIHTNNLNINQSGIISNALINKLVVFNNTVNINGTLTFTPESSIFFEKLTTDNLIVNNTMEELTINTLTTITLTTSILNANLLEVDDLIVNNTILTLTVDDIIINNPISSLNVSYINIIGSFNPPTTLSLQSVPITLEVLGFDFTLTLDKIGNLYQLKFITISTPPDSSTILLGTISNINDYPNNIETVFAQQTPMIIEVQEPLQITIHNITGEITLITTGSVSGGTEYACSLIYIKNSPIS